MAWIRQNFIKILLFSIVFVCLAGITLSNLVVSELHTGIVEDFKLQARHYPRILQDLRILEQNPIFENHGTTNNADDFLAQKINWMGNDIVPLKNPQVDLLNSVFRDHREWSHDEKFFKELVADPRLKEINTNWLNELHKFDHWDNSSNPHVVTRINGIKRKNSIERVGIWSAIPVPQYSELRKWAVVHLIKNKAKGHDEFLKITELLHSNGTLLSQMMATVMLKSEEKLLKRLNIKAQPRANAEMVALYKRLSWAWVGIMYSTFYSEIPKEIKSYMQPKYGACAGAWETVPFNSVYEDYFGGGAPFEPSYTDEIKRSQKISTKLSIACGLDGYKGFQERVPASSKPWFTTELNMHYGVPGYTLGNIRGPNPVLIPYIRRWSGMAMMSVATPNFLRQYDDLEK